MDGARVRPQPWPPQGEGPWGPVGPARPQTHPQNQRRPSPNEAQPCPRPHVGVQPQSVPRSKVTLPFISHCSEAGICEARERDRIPGNRVRQTRGTEHTWLQTRRLRESEERTAAPAQPARPPSRLPCGTRAPPPPPSPSSRDTKAAVLTQGWPGPGGGRARTMRAKTQGEDWAGRGCGWEATMPGPGSDDGKET